jgi:hypothetical protein
MSIKNIINKNFSEETVLLLLWKKPILYRVAYWLYVKLCGDIYLPKGKKILTVKLPKPDSLNDKKASACLSVIPKKFIPGIHDVYVFHELYKDGDEIRIV